MTPNSNSNNYPLHLEQGDFTWADKYPNLASKQVLVWPEPVLLAEAHPVPRGTDDDELLWVVNQMLETMAAYNGLGLAAPQVGIPWRLFVMANPEGEEHVLINPSAPRPTTEETVELSEACLSFPGIVETVSRAPEVKVSFTPPQEWNIGAVVTKKFDGVLAQCVQHEYEHLDGITMARHLSSVKRDILRRKLRKARRRGGL